MRCVIALFFALALYGVEPLPAKAQSIPESFSPLEPPQTLSPRFIHEQRLVPLRELPQEFGETLLMVQGKKNYVLPPIGTAITAGGTVIEPKDHKTQAKLFSQDTFASIPQGSKILVRKGAKSPDGSGKEFWEYPVGTLVAHRIRFKSERKMIYELRLVWLNAKREWVFATYSPDEAILAQGTEAVTVLKLNQYSRKPELPTYRYDAVFPLWAPGQTTSVAIKRINIENDSCKRCHFATSPAFYQYQILGPDSRIDLNASIQNTGPCGFAPTNPYVRSQWEPRYMRTRRLKESPFQNAP